MLFILSMVIVFHLGILVKLIPYNIAWGGRLTNDTEMYRFEIVSVFVNLFLMTILFIKGAYLKLQLNGKVINTVLWVFFVIFILNTIGNMLASTTFEKSFSVLTLILAVLLWNILMKKPVTG